MLLDDAQVVLNDVVVFCRQAAERHEYAAEILQDLALAAVLRELGAAHRANLEVLETHVRELGGLPRDADGDRETVEHLLTRLRAAFARDGRAAVLEEQIEAESHVQQAIDTALSEPALPERLPSELRGLRERVQAHQDRLRASRRAL